MTRRGFPRASLGPGQDETVHRAVVEAEGEVAGPQGEAEGQDGGVVRAQEGDLSAVSVARPHPEPGALFADPDHLPVTNTAAHTSLRLRWPKSL